MTTRILLIAQTADKLSSLSASLPSGGHDVEVVPQIGGVAELCATVLRDDIELAVVDLSAVGEPDLALLESTLAARPRTAVVLVCGEASTDFLLRAMRAGVREIVVPDSPSGSLSNALERQLGRRVAAAGTTRKARTIAFLSAKGGGGATFLATNLGFALAARERRVALLDLNLQFGDAALFVSEERTTHSIADVAREIDRLDPAFLEANMIKPHAGYYVLPAPDTPDRAVDVKPEAMERLFGLARTQYDFVLVDVGRVLDKVTVSALDEADVIYVVIQSTLPYLHNAKRLITVLTSLGYGREKVRLILNRYVKGDEIGVGQIESTLGMPVSVQIPNSFAAVAYSINHGLSILKHAPRDPVARSLVEMATSLAPAQAERGNWLRSIFRGR